MSPGWDKPPDVGTGVVCATFGRDGSWLSVACLHPRWGVVELNGVPPFDERLRGDPAATRRYRASLTDPRHAWLRLEPAAPGDGNLDCSTAETGTVSWSAAETGVPSAVAFGLPGSRGVVQRWQLGDGVARTLRVSGRLDRPSLAEITEVNPPAPTGATTELRADGGRLVVRSPELPAAAAIDVSCGSWTVVEGGAELSVPSGEPSISISVTLTPGLDVATEAIGGRGMPPAPSSPGRVRGRSWIEAVVARAVAYTRSCTALEYAPGERAILADHRLLPLSWTRDAYFQALLLLVAGEAADAERVADHLRWLMRRCERPGGRWMRSHHANGQPKDLAYQADQQLYPFLELADLWRATGALPRGVDWQRAVPDAWRIVVAAIDPATGLIGTEENAADDRADAPYVAASQVLLWYTAVRLAEPPLAVRTGLDAGDLLETARRVRDAFDRYLVTGGRWAYATDARRTTVDYHDANDLPVALAPMWGFCAADDPGWTATVEFAFSPANPGWIARPDPGLGSRHTPGVWPLGDIQAWLIGRIRGDDASAAAALDRLRRAAFSDGMLPESIVGDVDGTAPIRHWFAWPGAALAAFWLLDGRGETNRISAVAGDVGEHPRVAT